MRPNESLDRAELCASLQQVADDTLGALRSGCINGVVAVPDLPPVRVRLSGRLTHSAGIYRPGGDIAISTHYLAAHGLDGTRGVVLHEVAHHVVRSLHGRNARPHGREFKAIATALGGSLHAESFAAPRIIYLYRCPTCGWEWRRGRKVRRGRRYACARCSPTYNDRHRLVYLGRQREGA
jgi:predicted SprT family Zn-dependent metalloprotease